MELDLSECKQLKWVVRNSQQKVTSSVRYEDDLRQQELVDVEDVDEPDHSAIMPMLGSAVESPNNDIFDTSDYFGDENVSLGLATPIPTKLKNGDNITFENFFSMDRYVSIDERNLQHCKYLNLRGSGVKQFNTAYLPNLRLLDICFCEIRTIEPDNVKELEYINLSGTKIRIINLTKLKKLYMVLGCKRRPDIRTHSGTLRCDDIGNVLD